MFTSNYQDYFPHSNKQTNFPIISNLNTKNLFPFRFWYVSLVSCYRNTTSCEWHHFDPRRFNLSPDAVPDIVYDFHLVNGNPNQSAFIPLAFQFSSDQQYTFEMYLIFILVYTVLIPLQVYAMRRQRHPVTRLFTVSLVLEFISLVLILVHMIKFAMHGEGNEKFRFVGDIFDIFSRVSEKGMNEKQQLFVGDNLLSEKISGFR